MKVLSFIIPAYNSQAFLDKCICSMLSPAILDKLEILVVNDGSTDATVEIAQRYCAQYPSVVRLISQENKGHGGALNTGCAQARGTYLKVVDADDWVETENLPKFMQLLEGCNSDVVLTHHRTIDIGTGEVKNWRSYPDAFERAYGFQEIMCQWRNFDRSLTFHGITYRTAFYHRYATPLPEHVFYEDHEYATFPCCYGESVTCFDLFVYDYRIGDVNQSVSNQNQLRRMVHTEQVLVRMLEEYQTLPEGYGKGYAAMKIQGLLLSYFTTALLVNPNRSEGRGQAKAMVSLVRSVAPEICVLTKGKYRFFCGLNRLRIGKTTWDALLNAKLIRLVRGTRTFE